MRISNTFSAFIGAMIAVLCLGVTGALDQTGDVYAMGPIGYGWLSLVILLLSALVIFRCYLISSTACINACSIAIFLAAGLDYVTAESDFSKLVVYAIPYAAVLSTLNLMFIYIYRTNVESRTFDILSWFVLFAATSSAALLEFITGIVTSGSLIRSATPMFVLALAEARSRWISVTVR